MDNHEKVTHITVFPIGIVAMILENLDLTSFLAFCSTCSQYRVNPYIKFYETVVKRMFPKYLKHPKDLEESAGRPYLLTNELWRQRLVVLKEKSKQNIIKFEDAKYQDYRNVKVSDELADLMGLEHYGIRNKITSILMINMFLCNYSLVMTLSGQKERLSTTLKKMFFVPVGERSRFSIGIEDMLDWNNQDRTNLELMVVAKYMSDFDGANDVVYGNDHREPGTIEDYIKYDNCMQSFNSMTTDILSERVDNGNRNVVIQDIQRTWLEHGFSY